MGDVIDRQDAFPGVFQFIYDAVLRYLFRVISLISCKQHDLFTDRPETLSCLSAFILSQPYTSAASSSSLVNDLALKSST
jgi:hypothetical protein